ncbi:hypothetical protein [uncultured Jannaschia sp.]|uniref:hypothetical protein n=1 Tax=uncultured Jannaschia sp. TaxID=293347 RepID=UPI00261D7199|nr:hypothetical protein [uncultured Jannaschia sp.]
MTLRTLTLIAALVGLAGCGTFDSLASGASGPFSGGGGLRGSATEVGGVRFRTRVSGDGRAFTTATRGADRSVAGALEAGRVKGVEYCIKRYGGSDITWTIGPDRPVEEVVLGDGGALILQGTCVTR